MTDLPRRAKRRYLIIPFAVFGLLFLAYTVVWFVGAGIMEREVDKFIALERDMGRKVSFSARKIEGYPFALRTQINDFQWSEANHWSWSGKALYIMALPYDVERIVLAPRGEQFYTYKDRAYTIEAKYLNIGLKDGAYGAQGESVVIDGHGQRLSLGSLKANWEEYANGWRLSSALRQVKFTESDGSAVEVPMWDLQVAQPDTIEEIEVQRANFVITDGAGSAPTILNATGTAGVDSSNRPRGTLTVSLFGEAALLDVLRRYGVLDEAQASEITSALAAYRTANPKGEITLTARDGRLLLLGLVPIAELNPIF